MWIHAAIIVITSTTHSWFSSRSFFCGSRIDGISRLLYTVLNNPAGAAGVGIEGSREREIGFVWVRHVLYRSDSKRGNFELGWTSPTVGNLLSARMNTQVPLQPLHPHAYWSWERWKKAVLYYRTPYHFRDRWIRQQLRTPGWVWENGWICWTIFGAWLELLITDN